jgi:hypothetical protein
MAEECEDTQQGGKMYQLETKEDFEEFLLAASQLIDEGETLGTQGDPREFEEVMNFRYTF